MSHVTLTTRSGDTQKLSLPLRAEEFLKSPVPYFLTYGKATPSFDMPDAALNQALETSLPQEVRMKELSLLAYILGKTDVAQLSELKNKLPRECHSMDELFQSVCSPVNLPWLTEQHTRFIRQDMESQRMTGGQLFEKIVDCARESGDLARFDTIIEYVLPEEYEEAKLCSYEFNMLPAMGFGCEGIYIDCYLKGSFDESDRPSLHIGTIKTLRTDLDACKIMGELCGALLYHESKYVNENLYRFDSADSIERMIAQKLRLEQAPSQAPTMTCQQL
ncbi:hypothetical protein DSECCO2_226950 [anaerobic digester metagenome]